MRRNRVTTVPVSVVLPVFNAARFLPEAVRSILGQTYDAFELIVVDDGSVDGSGELAADLAASDPRVEVIRRRHEGLVPALNAGLERARGHYVARMDADDVAHAERFQRQVAYLDAHPASVAVGSAMEVVDADG